MEIATEGARISLRNDYSEGPHPRLLQALAVASAEINRGYGLDAHCVPPAALIRDLLARDADGHFLAGGSQSCTTGAFGACAVRVDARPYPAGIVKEKMCP